MKTKVLVLLIALVSIILMPSCQSKKSEGKKTALIETRSPEAAKMKEEIVKIINDLPTNTETVNLINATGAAYLAGFTGEDIKTENLLTRADKARAYGTIIFDLAYTNTYNQTESFSKLLKIYQDLTSQLGFEELVQIQKQFKDRYQKNKNNSDSVDFLVNDMLKRTNDLIQSSGSTADISLVFAGAIVKSLNVISYLTLFAPEKEKLIEVLQNQKDVINAACRILQKTADDQDVNKLYQALVPINNLYNSSATFSTQTIEQINKLTGFISQ